MVTVCGGSVLEAKGKVRDVLIKQGQALVYAEPEKVRRGSLVTRVRANMRVCTFMYV